MPYSKNKRDKVLKALENLHGNVSAACQAVGINRKTFYDWVKKYPEFAAKSEEIVEGKIDNVESVLYAQCMEGNTSAIIFFLKTKGKSRGYIERAEVNALINTEADYETWADQFRKKKDAPE